MLVTVFATLAIAAQPDMSDLVPPKYDDQKYCMINNYARGCGDTIQQAVDNACSAALPIAKPKPDGIRIPQNSYCDNDSIRTTGYYTQEYGGGPYSSQIQLRSNFLPDSDKYICPPDTYPYHIITVPTPTESNPNAIMCAKTLVENKCPDPQSTDSYVFGTATSPANICYDNPEDDSQCVINTDDSGGYYLPSKYNSQEPTQCEARPKSDGKDKFCTATGSSGVYSVVCPESSISFDITGIQKNADQLVVNHQRISEIEASFLTQQDIDSLVASGQLKGEKGDQGEKGDKGEKG